jgi:PAS domain S-box-containing protein
MTEKIRVLYVDDETSLLELCKLFLERSRDFTVTIATSAPEAIRMLEKERFDTIISDYQMPEMDGIEFLKHLKAEGNTTPFIIFTGKGREDVVIEALNAGADGYLQKGGETKSQFAELSHKIKKAVEGQRAEKALQASETHLQATLDSTADGILAVDNTGKVLQVSRQFAKLWRIPPALMDGCDDQALLDFVLDQLTDPDTFLKKMQALYGSEAVDMDRLAFKDGRVFERYSLPMIKDDTLIGRVWSFRDITERKRTEEMLHGSEERYQVLIDKMPDYIFVHNKDGVVYVNPAATQSLGYTTEELQTSPFTQFIAPESYEIVKNALEQRETGVLVNPYEIVVLTKDGARRTCLVQGSWLTFNNTLSTMVVLTDINERKQAEDALRESESKYKRLVTMLNEGIWAIDRNATTTFVNPTMAKMLGYTPDEMIGKPAYAFTPPDLHEHAKQDISAAQNGESRQREISLLKKDGTKIYALMETVEIWDADGKHNGGIAAVMDITERKRIEEAIRESEKRFRNLVETTSDWVWEVDENGHYTYVSPQALAIVGYTPQELLGKTPFDLMLPKEVARVGESFSKIIAAQQPFSSLENTNLHKDGHIVVLDTSGVPVFRPDGTFSGYRGIDRDITERKRAEDALRQANKQLNLLSSITRHDILNQLMALKGYIELSRDYLDDKKTLDDFLGKEEKTARTIEDQITFTKDYQELGAAAPEWQGVNASIKKALTGLPMRNIHVEVDPKVPEIFADPLFVKVFYNLIDNALRYGGDQMKTIRVSSQESDANLTILCEDDGVGISDEDKKHLFTRGFGKNTGLGLFLSREILAMTGITITENGTPGKGARFEILVPKGMWRFTETGGKIVAPASHIGKL